MVGERGGKVCWKGRAVIRSKEVKGEEEGGEKSEVGLG